MKELATIIERLKVPKDKENTFGKYKYRSCESILESVKPIVAEQGCVLNLSDDIVSIDGVHYVKATATIILPSGDRFHSQGFAREDFDKKGMDAPQMTGTASSYARKYALNGLFCIDDTKDADTDEYAKENARRMQIKGVPQTPPTKKDTRKVLTLADVQAKEEKFLEWLRGRCEKARQVEGVLNEYYKVDTEVVDYLREKF